MLTIFFILDFAVHFKMPFGKKFLILYLLVSVMLVQQQVAVKLNLRKFGVTFGKKVEKSLGSSWKKFQEKIKQDQKRKEEEEMEEKRNKVFRKYLLNHVSGSFLKDFISRF